MEIRWEGKGLKEKCIYDKTGNTIIKINPKFYIPAEVDVLIGDPSKAIKELGWNNRTSFDQLVNLMVQSEIKNYK